MVPLSNNAPIFHRRRRAMVVVETALDHQGCIAGDGLETHPVAFGLHHMSIDVGPHAGHKGQVVMDSRRILLNSPFQINYRRQRLVLHPNLIYRVFGNVTYLF